VSDQPETAPEQAPNQADVKPRVNRFRKRFDGVRLSPEAAQRQGRAATLAFERFRDSEAVKTFLNTHDDALGGRPIDLAVESAAGLAKIEQALSAR
jgi:uncharacterized protein (DUF2384 family)